MYRRYFTMTPPHLGSAMSTGLSAAITKNGVWQVHTENSCLSQEKDGRNRWKPGLQHAHNLPMISLKIYGHPGDFLIPHSLNQVIFGLENPVKQLSFSSWLLPRRLTLGSSPSWISRSGSSLWYWRQKSKVPVDIKKLLDRILAYLDLDSSYVQIQGSVYWALGYWRWKSASLTKVWYNCTKLESKIELQKYLLKCFSSNKHWVCFLGKMCQGK